MIVRCIPCESRTSSGTHKTEKPDLYEVGLFCFLRTCLKVNFLISFHHRIWYVIECDSHWGRSQRLMGAAEIDGIFPIP